MERSEKLFYLALLGVIVLGAYIRLLPVLNVGTEWLADLDPYRNLRAVDEILILGRMPVFDPLSAAPNGTYAIYGTAQGYYMLSAALTIVSGSKAIEFMSLSPVICEIVLLLTIYVFGSTLTGKRGVGLVAAFFVTIPHGWAMISSIGTAPVAENFGRIFFPIVLLLLLRYNGRREKNFLAGSGLILGVAFLIHPMTYIYLNATVLLHSVIMWLVEKKTTTLVAFLKVLAISFFVLMIQFRSLTDFQTSIGFSKGALWLTSLQPPYQLINFYIVLDEVGVPVLFLSLLALVLILYERKTKYFVLISWSFVMFAIVSLSSVNSIRQLLADFPFGWSVILSHRVMPYLPLVLSLLVGIAIIEYIWPLSNSFLKILNTNNSAKFPQANSLVIFLIILISIPLVQSSFGYAQNYKGATIWAMQYDNALHWIRSNSEITDVFVVNDVGLGEVIRTFAKRPVVFTISYQDLVSPDLEMRMLLLSSLFVRGYDDKLSQRLLFDFNVSYVLVVKGSSIDVVNKRYTLGDENFSLFVKWMSEKPYLFLVHSDDELFYVYRVNQSLLFKGEITLPKVQP